MKTVRTVRGFSLTEILVATTLLSFIVLFGVIYLDRSRILWRSVNANQDAGMTLRKSYGAIRDDLSDVSEKEFGVTDNGAGSGKMGQAFWFLSARDPATGVFVRAADGRPFWQKNILFYLTVPNDHDQRYGVACTVFNRVCSHKILVRKVIDAGNPTSPTSDEEDEEVLLNNGQVLEHLIRPANIDLSVQESMAGVVEARYITGSLLDMNVTLDEEGGRIREISVLLEAGLIEAARNRIDIGRDEFTSPSLILARTVGVIPRNY